MNKYLTVFLVSWQNEFVYRLNFLLWRLRNLLRFSMTYFLWLGIFSTNSNVYGYNQSSMLTYVFMVLFMGTLVLSAPSSDNIGGEIGNGDLSNYLVKPIGYLKYWFVRDLASKSLNLFFALFELFLIWFFLRPALFFPSDVFIIIGFLISAILAVGIYYLLSSLTRFMAFWSPENIWGLAFLLIVLIEILSGGIFPLNILPKWVFVLLQFTPFPYLVYFPITIISGKLVGLDLLRILAQSSIWLMIIYFLTKFVWKKGLVVYQSYGK